MKTTWVQTQASAAGTLSAIIFILPGLLMLGYWNGFPFWQTFLLCACGGSLGVLFTIPLRRAMVVNSDLPYPEGRAAAEILKVGSHNGGQGPQSSSGMGRYRIRWSCSWYYQSLCEWLQSAWRQHELPGFL